MKSFFKNIYLAILLIAAVSFTANAQVSFIDSIRNMLQDLNSEVQHVPINQLLSHITPFCTGAVINDSLEAGLKKLLSDEYLYNQSLLQPVSPHLWKKYISFQKHIALAITERSRGEDSIKNEVWVYFLEIKKSIFDPPALTILSLDRIREKIKDLPVRDSFQRAKTIYTLRYCYYNPELAYPVATAGLKLNPHKTAEEKTLYVNSLFLLACILREIKKTDSACFVFKQQLDLAKKLYGTQHEEYALMLLQVADQYAYMQKYQEAMQMDLQALEIAKAVNGINSNLYAVLCNQIGELYVKTGLYVQARPWMEDALTIKERIFGKTYFDNVVTLHGLASVYKYAGLYEEAIQLLQQSAAITKSYFGEQDRGYGYDLHALADAYTLAGSYEKALPLYEEAISILGKIIPKANYFYPKALHSLACLYAQVGQYDKAAALFENALALKNEFEPAGESSTDYITTLNKYAEACIAKGDYKKALELQLQSIAINNKILQQNNISDSSVNAFIAAAWHNLASVYLQMNNASKAAQACNTALVMRKRMYAEDHPDIAASFDLTGDIQFASHQYSKALFNYRQAYHIRKKILSPAHPDFIKSLYNMGLTEIKNDNIEEGINSIALADSLSLLHLQASYISFSAEEKLAYLHSIEKQFSILPSLLYLKKTKSAEIKKRVFQNAIALKSNVLLYQLDINKNIHANTVPGMERIYTEWRFNKAILGKQLLLPVKDRMQNFDSLTEATVHLEEKLSLMSATFRENNSGIEKDIADFTQKLKPGEALIEFTRFRLYDNEWTNSFMYAAIILLPDKDDVAFIPLCTETALKNVLHFTANNGKAAINYLYPPAGHTTEAGNQLYKILWQPLQPYLQGIHCIYYAPCGLLHTVSFAAMHFDKNQSLYNKFDLHQLISIHNMQSVDTADALPQGIELWGGINYSMQPAAYAKHDNTRQQWGALPGTKKEIENIDSLYKASGLSSKLVSGDTATEILFKKSGSLSPAFLHIATHGFFAGTFHSLETADNNNYPAGQSQINLFHTGLILSTANHSVMANSQAADENEDGILTAYEIEQLDFRNTRLVTLSTCVSGIGNIDATEGIFGLQRAFKQAGARQILISLWDIPDETTIYFMQLFYTKLLEQNNPHEALHFARKTMEEKYTPYYWAGFVLVE